MLVKILCRLRNVLNDLKLLCCIIQVYIILYYRKEGLHKFPFSHANRCIFAANLCLLRRLKNIITVMYTPTHTFTHAFVFACVCFIVTAGCLLPSVALRMCDYLISELTSVRLMPFHRDNRCT